MLLRAVASVGTMLALAACGAGGGQPPAASNAPAESGGRAPAGPAVSINALMVDWIDHAGHVLWNAEREGQRPATDADWQELERHATQTAAAGALIALGGTGPTDQLWSRQAQWQDLSREMTSAGLKAAAAIKARNLDDLVRANGDLVDTCERCHKAFKPDAPTEGLTHKPH